MYCTCVHVEELIDIVIVFRLVMSIGNCRRKVMRCRSNKMEEDTDEEILSLKNRYERQLRQQTDENLKLRGDTGILRKKVWHMYSSDKSSRLFYFILMFIIMYILHIHLHVG